MFVWVVFFVSVLVNSTTPLAIQWSQQGVGLFLAVTVRMMLALLICLGLHLLSRTPLPRTQQAIHTYLIGGLGFFFGVSCCYWGLQWIPSGWTAVLFGLSPIFNGLIAKRFLSESFGWNRAIGSLLGLAGLGFIFHQSSQSELSQLGLGVAITLVAVTIFSFTSVFMKKVGHNINPMAITTGCLMVMIPCFFASWYVKEGGVPLEIPWRSLGAILYLALVSTVIGFIALYYLLGKVDATVAALPNLLAPALAVWLGVAFNGETLQPGFLLGTAFILLGLSIFQWRSSDHCKEVYDRTGAPSAGSRANP